MGNVCGSPSVKESGPTAAVKVEASQFTRDKATTAAVKPDNSTHDVSNHALDQKQSEQHNSCQSVQAVKGDTPGAISIRVAPAPPPDEYPEIKAAVMASQKEVKAGAKLKFANLYTLGKVIGTGHYAR
jgi:hypothetical protein